MIALTDSGSGTMSEDPRLSRVSPNGRCRPLSRRRARGRRVGSIAASSFASRVLGFDDTFEILQHGAIFMTKSASAFELRLEVPVLRRRRSHRDSTVRKCADISRRLSKVSSTSLDFSFLCVDRQDQHFFGLGKISFQYTVEAGSNNCNG